MRTVFEALEVPMVAFGLGNANSRDHGGGVSALPDYYHLGSRGWCKLWVKKCWLDHIDANAFNKRNVRFKAVKDVTIHIQEREYLWNCQVTSGFKSNAPDKPKLTYCKFNEQENYCRWWCSFTTIVAWQQNSCAANMGIGMIFQHFNLMSQLKQ